MSNEMTVSKIFNEEALALLEFRLEESDHPKTFLLEADKIASDPKNLIDFPHTIQFEESLVPSADEENARLVYEAVGSIDRSNAADPRLWSYLSIVTLREYMSERWSLETARNFKNQANDHWLMTTANPRKLMRNGAARLWWVADLTCDMDLVHPYSAETGDPFAYTRWVMENENRRQSIFERRLGRSPRLRWAVMEAMQAMQEAGKPDRSKALLKKVYLHTGYQRLEALPDDELKSVVEGLLLDVLENGK